MERWLGTPSAPNGWCRSFVSVLPPSTFIPPEMSCARERVSALATGKLADSTGVSVNFSLSQQTLAAIRYEFNESALEQLRERVACAAATATPS